MTKTVQCRAFAMLSLFLVTLVCYGQKTELRANAYSGLFSFRGNGATTYTSTYFDDVLGYGNAFRYGTESGFSFAGELQVQRVTRRKHFYGLGVSFERLQSRTTIDSSFGMFGGYQADGKQLLTNDFITLNPYVGHRLGNHAFTVDIQAGVDLAFCIRVMETVKIKSGRSGVYTENVRRPNHPFDVRPRLQVNVSYKRLGLLAGYSVGTKNLFDRYSPMLTDYEAFTSFLRFGMSYRLN